MVTEAKACVVSIEIDGRQKYLFETDKLREMLGASQLMDQTQQWSYPKEIKVFQPASGDIKLWCEKEHQKILLDKTWKCKEWLTEKGIAHTIAYVEVSQSHFTEPDPNPSLEELDPRQSPVQPSLSWVHSHLSEHSRNLKSTKAYEDATPRCALFANCRIHGWDTANYYVANAAESERKDARRSLTGYRAEAKFNEWQINKKLFYDQYLKEPLFKRLMEILPTEVEPLNELKRASTFSDLSQDIDDSSRTDQYIALVCADGDGMGQLLEGLVWNAPDWEPKGKEPWQHNQDFSITYDKCVRDAFVFALVDTLLPLDEPEKAGQFYSDSLETSKIAVPFLPQLIGGDDLWLVGGKSKILTLCYHFAHHYADLTSKLLDEALRISRQYTNDPTLTLTISMGIAFAKASYPAIHMIGLAEQLLKSAKALRKEQLWGRKGDAKLEGCLDWHWIESSREETLQDARQSGWSYVNGQETMLLTSRPWTVAQTEKFIKAAQLLHLIPRRKREQLETILRLGYQLSKLAWKSWWDGLQTHEDKDQQKIMLAMNEALPEVWQLTAIKESPWRELTDGTSTETATKVYATPLIDLLALQHVLGLEGKTRGEPS